jgi:serine/threonine protein kinase
LSFVGNSSDWEKVEPEPLGSGGQSTVYLVRRPERRAARAKSFKTLRDLSGQSFNDQRALDFAKASVDVAREEHPSELGALKIFKPRETGPEAEQQALARMQNEIAVLEQNRPGLLKLLDYNKRENWIVTEYCSKGTLERHLNRYKGNAKLALASFVSLVRTVAELHKDPIVHRDIKPQNLFLGDADNLLLGDFGIVFLPNQPERLSVTGESVGPRDFMPPWVLLDEQPIINPTFDVYMLGKVLWCMVAGRLKLHREDFRDRRFNLTVLFPNDPDMHAVNTILEKTVVTREEDCLGSAQDLLLVVGALSEIVQRGGRILRDGVPMRCRVCQVGNYYRAQRIPDSSVSLAVNRLVNGVYQHINVLRMSPFICDRCGHVQVFKA